VLDERPSVLLVDDDAPRAELVGEYLRTLGHRVQVARDGRDALDLLAEGLPQVIVAATRMPRLGGVELVAELRASQLPVAVVLITGHTDLDGAFAGLQAGAQGVVRSPFSLRELHQTVVTAARWSARMSRVLQLGEVQELVDQAQSAEPEELGLLCQRLAQAALEFGARGSLVAWEVPELQRLVPFHGAGELPILSPDQPTPADERIGRVDRIPLRIEARGRSRVPRGVLLVGGTHSQNDVALRGLKVYASVVCLAMSKILLRTGHLPRSGHIKAFSQHGAPVADWLRPGARVPPDEGPVACLYDPRLPSRALARRLWLDLRMRGASWLPPLDEGRARVELEMRLPAG
jgi:CheY-like chemotaxis protein